MVTIHFIPLLNKRNKWICSSKLFLVNVMVLVITVLCIMKLEMIVA